MNSRRAIRQCALEMMYQFDARSDQDAQEILDSTLSRLDELPLSEGDIRKSWALAREAHRSRRASDLVVGELAPAWPAVRQPAMDRAILRLAHFEMTAGDVPPKVAVNEAVELAKKFGSEKSASFVNGILDKVLRQVLAQQDAPARGKESV
ncbi:MAG: transcription antitermination factor NusB [Planctomycetota bacterium]|jgi:N utilization substance protein B